MVVVEVVGVYLAVTVQVGIEALYRHSVLVVDLLVHIIAVRLITLGEHLYIVRLDSSGKRIGRFGEVVQSKVCYLVALVGGIGTDIPLPVVCHNGSGIDRYLIALALDVAHIAQHLLVEVCSGGNRNCGQQVFSLAVVIVERTRHSVAEDAKVETEVPCLGSLPCEVAVVC